MHVEVSIPQAFEQSRLLTVIRLEVVVFNEVRQVLLGKPGATRRCPTKKINLPLQS